MLNIAILGNKQGKNGFCHDGRRGAGGAVFNCNGQFAFFDHNASLGKTVKSWRNDQNRNRGIPGKKTTSLGHLTPLPKSPGGSGNVGLSSWPVPDQKDFFLCNGRIPMCIGIVAIGKAGKVNNGKGLFTIPRATLATILATIYTTLKRRIVLALSGLYPGEHNKQKYGLAVPGNMEG